MKVTYRALPEELDGKVSLQVLTDVGFALQSVTTEDGKFIVNDTLWYMVNPKGAIKPTVVNSANYISRKFQDSLVDQGWVKEKLIDNQKIDGYLEIEVPGGYSLGRSTFFAFLEGFCNENEDLDLAFAAYYFYKRYVIRQCYSIGHIPSKYHHHFQFVEQPCKVRIGLEFETGNIASSFRAFSKLSACFENGYLDAGVFITSIDKSSAATRIWPVSNRNGSFQELDQRNYRRNITFPLWEVGFSPDGFRADVGYLSSGGGLYTPESIGNVKFVEGQRFEVYTGDGGVELLKPLSPLDGEPLLAFGPSSPS